MKLSIFSMMFMFATCAFAHSDLVEEDVARLVKTCKSNKSKESQVHRTKFETKLIVPKKR